VVARVDRTKDPALVAGLLLARRGQAYFSRKLNELTDTELDSDSLLAGWDRRHLVAHVGLNARALTRLTEWAATGVEKPMYDSPRHREEEIELASTLPAQALRNLSDHAAIHLSVEWRDLEPARWDAHVRTIQGRTVPASETVWMRTREVWIHAVDLGNGGSFDDFPPELVDALLSDVMVAWDRRRAIEELPTFTLHPLDRDGPLGTGTVQLRGPAAQLAQWATGRGGSGLTTMANGSDRPPPRWL